MNENAIDRKLVCAFIDGLISDDGEREKGLEYIRNMPPVTPQQSCEDIAKAFQFGMALGFAKKHDEMDKVMEEVKKAVMPQPKTGHWIYKQYDGYPECGNWHCSECDEIDNRTSAYCPNCGTKMESEDKE